MSLNEAATRTKAARTMRHLTTSRRFLTVAVVGAALTGAALVWLLRPATGASAATATRATCSATVDVVGAGLPQAYQSAFTVTSAQAFVDDRGRGAREETFTARIVGDEVEVHYEKDTSSTDGVRLDTTLVFAGDRAAQNGRAVTTSRSRADLVLTYAVTCRR